jgi:rod shape-determining protein MreD
LALLFQTTLAHFLVFHAAVPSAVLVVVVWYAIRVDTRRAALYGLVAGLCEDIIATNTGGAWTMSTTLVAVLAGLLSRNFFADSLPLAATMVALATLTRAGLFWSIRALEGYPPGLGSQHLHEALWQALFNAVLMAGGILIARRVGEA